MFVPVACTECGKPFQVPEPTIGKPTVCPWCQATVLALPVGVPAAQSAPIPTLAGRPSARQESQQPEPLTLDDAPVPAARSRWLRWWVIGLGLLALVIATSATIAVLRYKQGYGIAMEWKGYTPPDNSCTLDLLGRPAEDTTTESGERRYISEGWYSGASAWVGWRDLNQTQVQLAITKDSWRLLGPVFDTERERLKTRYGGTMTAEKTIKFEDPLTHEVRLELPQGRLIERMIVLPGGSRPRVYFVGMLGKIDPDGAEVKRLFDTFRVME